MERWGFHELIFSVLLHLINEHRKDLFRLKLNVSDNDEISPFIPCCYFIFYGWI
jgi:hypothetical protein